MSLTVGSLFAGIGGFDLGFERAGYDIRWQVEIDPWARAVLAKHWPHVHRHDDICTAGAHNLETVDVLCGGFPCQDISLAGKGAGITDGTRSGLWSEYARLIRELRPRYVVVENVAALLARGLGRVLGDLAACGYDAEWQCIRASDMGAPHRRDRLWVLAYPNGIRCDRHAECDVFASTRITPPRRHYVDGLALAAGTPWMRESAVGRMDHGLPHRPHRLRGLGNAIVPQIAEWIAHRITDAEARRLVA